MSTLFKTALIAASKVVGPAVTIALVITSLNLICRLFSNASLPRNLPWVGVGKHDNFLGRARGNLRGFFHLKELLDEGYEKYSKNGQTYVLPYFINGPQVVLPPSQIPWLMDQPDEVLSQMHVNRQFLEADYAFFHANRADSPVHPEVIAHQLTKRIGSFADDVADEVRACLDEYWGTDTEEWREIKVYDTLLSVITRMSIRVFMGRSLCRDDAFVAICGNFIRNVVLAATAISLFPAFLKPIFGPIFTLYDYYLYRRCSSYIMPIIHERLDQLGDPVTRKLARDDPQAHNDYVQWAIDHALAKPVMNPAEFEPRVIAARFAVLGFAAIQSSVITLVNAIFDLAASGSCGASLAAMREEVLREAEAAVRQDGAGGGAWSKTALARMAHIDSALRESLRMNGFIERGIMKMVVAPEGITIPDGSHIPYGTKVGVSGWSIHHDEEVYPDAMRYDAFRFVPGQETDETGGKKKPQGLVNTSETFLSFSHGSHACPGRFFATNQLKIALGHIALLYDIEPIAERPVNMWIWGHIAPPLTEKLRVRRRKV